MIDPANITNFNRSDSELEEMILFAILVAGKNARTQAKKLQEFLGEDVSNPFKFISNLISSGTLRTKMIEHGLGKYSLLENSFKYLTENFSGSELRNVSSQELLDVPGIGLKTVNFFFLHCRENHDLCVLDTHILAWMKDNGIQDVPSVSPNNRELYNKFSDIFKDLVKIHMPTLSLAEADLAIWREYSSRRSKKLVDSPSI